MRVTLIASPVVYTNNAGGGPDEVQAPQSGEDSKDFYAGGTVVAAWYCPYDNIDDFGAINRIGVEPNGTSVRLVVSGQSGHRNARVRIRIYAQLQ
jgi:hypothetical protein